MIVTADVAKILNVDPSHIRRLAIKHHIGVKLSDRVRVFGDLELESLRNLIGLTNAGRPRKIAPAAETPDVRRCTGCGCHDLDCSGCIERTGWPCHWISEDRCSACGPAPAVEALNACVTGCGAPVDPATSFDGRHCSNCFAGES